jgi:ABC-2 type transport system permease protein
LTAATPAAPEPTPGAATGSIYDLGYRGYDGPRLGRRHAVTTLFLHTLRSCYGIGRGGRAKIAPIVLAGMAIIPAIIAVGVLAIARQAGAGGQIIEEASPIRYETYFGVIMQIVALFCAAQAPELLGRDQRYQVLPLYFSRAIERSDYALAKLAGFFVALLALVLAPQAVIFFGLVLSAPDLGVGLSENLPKVVPIVAQAATLAAVFGTLSMVIAAFTPRRAYATVAIIAAFVIPPVVLQLIQELQTDELVRWLAFLDPPDVIEATNAFFFGIGRANPDIVRAADHPGELWLLVAALWFAICAVILVRRYQKISA